MTDPRSAGLFAALRAAARVSPERFLVGIADATERTRVVAALRAEGEVVEAPSTDEALSRLAEESFEIAVLDLDDRQGSREPVGAARELRPFADLVFVGDAEPARVTELCAHEAA